MTEALPLDIHLLDKVYKISCPPGEQENLRRAAALLDRRMRDIRAGSRVMTLERLAVITALNLAHELMNPAAAAPSTGEGISAAQVAELMARLDQALPE